MIGKTLGHYKIIEKLAAGGMGEVYKARDQNLGRDVAVKVLPPDFAQDSERMARFEREAKALAKLAHPNILTIFDFGRDAEVTYAVTELLEGETLRDRLAEGALPWRKAAEMAAAIADGLASAHSQGIVHCDLKPGNVFLTRDGRIKILDFGLARSAVAPLKEAETRTSLETDTTPGTVLGTVGYMAPEQVQGKAADHRSDIFSLGCTLYEMLAGKRAFDRDSAVETLHAILKAEPAEIVVEGAPISPGMERLVRRCLEKEPAARFQSTSDLAFALKNLLDTSGSGLHKVVNESPVKPHRHTFVLLALAIGLIVGLAAGAGLVVWHSPKPAPAPPLIRPLTFSSKDYAPSVSPDGRTIAFVSERDGRQRIWIKQIETGAENPVTEGSDSSPRISPDGNWIFFTRVEKEDTTSLFKVALFGGEARRIVRDARYGDWSPDGKRIAYTRFGAEGEGAAILIADYNGTDERQIVRLQDRVVSGLRWSPDGQTLSVLSTGVGVVSTATLLVDAATGKPEVFEDHSPGTGSSIPNWAAEGRELVRAISETYPVAGSSTTRFVVRNKENRTEHTIFGTQGLTDVVEVLDGGKVIFDSWSRPQNLREYELTKTGGATPMRWLTRGAAASRQPRFAQDGSILFSSLRSGNLDLWRVSATIILTQLTQDPSQDWDPAISSDGRWLIWSSNRSGHYEIWIAEADGSNPHQLSQDGFDAENPVITSDGQWIVYKSGNPQKTGIWKIRPDGSGAVKIATQGSHPEVSPDGLYVLSDDTIGLVVRAIRVVRLENGAPAPFEIRLSMKLPNTLSSQSGLGRCRWMPDGKAIAFTGLDDAGLSGVFVQDFVPGRDTTATRRKLAGFNPDYITETFAISPDGTRIVLSLLDLQSNIMMAEGIRGLTPARRKQ